MRLPTALLAFLAASPCLLMAEPPPAWVATGGLDPDAFPPSRFLTGYGLSSPGGTEVEQRLQAQSMAREALAATFRTHITSEFTSRTTQKDQQLSRFAQNLVSTRAEVELQGLDTVLTWTDPQHKATHALAVLDKPRTLRLVAETLDREATACTQTYTRAKAAGDTAGLLEARHLREHMEEGLLVRTVLGGGGAEPACPAQAEIDGELRRLLAVRGDLGGPVALAALDLGARLPRGVRVLMDNITYADTPFCGSLSAWLEQALAAELVAYGQVKVVDKTAGREAIRTGGMDANLADALRSQAVVRGTCFELGEEVQLSLRITSATGEELSAATLKVPAALIRKAGLKLVPDNYLEARKALEILDARVQDSTLKVKVALDRGEGGIYREGEKLHLFLKANLDCYVKVLYHQVDGTNVLVFPNKYHPDGRIDKGVLYQIPPDDNSFVLQVEPPFGVEMVKVMASTQPLAVEGKDPDANGLAVVKEDLAKLLGRTRGIALKKAEAQYAEATAVVNTMAGK